MYESKSSTLLESKSLTLRWPRWTGALAFGLGLWAIFVVRVIREWPLAMAFQNFAFKDTGSFRYVNSLLDMGLRPSVDFGFSYGLLGLLVQRIDFAIFGTGHWTTLGFTGVFLATMVIYWWLLAREFGFTWLNFALLLGLYEMIVGLQFSGPTPAHDLQRALLVYSLWCALKGRLRLALVLAVLAALAIPSLPIILIGLLSVTIVLEWWQTPQRTLRNLAGQFVPAIIVYVLGVLTFVVIFGWRSALPSLLPTQGMAMYHAMNFGFFAKYGLASGRTFWDPMHPTIAYYLHTNAGMWLFCSGLLVIFGVVSLAQMIRNRKASGVPLFVFLCCALHLSFVFFAFGGPMSSVYYEFILVAGVLAGMAELRDKRLRIVVSCAILILGLMSNRAESGLQRLAWRTWHRSPEAAGLYAPDDFRREWTPILGLASSHDLLLLSYGTGVSMDFPQVKTPRSWFLLPGIVLPAEDANVLEQIRKSNVVVEYLSAPTLYIAENVAWQAALAQFPVRLKGTHFRVWMRNAADGDALMQTTDFRPEKVMIDPEEPR
jgi:hypothetical protein